VVVETVALVQRRLRLATVAAVRHELLPVVQVGGSTASFAAMSTSPARVPASRARLVVRVRSFHPKQHRSGCDLAAALELDEALVSVGSVAVGDVAGQGVGEASQSR
jgi:hypothetical protein